VPRERSNVLLWIYPLVGAVGSLQLMAKTRGLGSQLVSRLAFRNFYTSLPWGVSDYVSAVMEFMICGCVLLLMLERRTIPRIFIAGSGVLALAAFLVLLSRGGAIGLLVFGLAVVLGIGGRRTVVAALSFLGAVVLTLVTPGGRALLSRFSDPSQQGSVYIRFALWQTSWNRFLGNPWTGVGINQGRYQHDLFGANSGGNFLLDYMAEQGIFGGLLLCAILVAAFRMAARAEPVGVNGPFRPVRAVLIGMLLEWVTHASVEPTLGGVPLAVAFTFLLTWLTLQDPRGRSTSRLAPAPAPTALSGAANTRPARG
jgi:O-antigen ligase